MECQRKFALLFNTKWKVFFAFVRPPEVAYCLFIKSDGRFKFVLFISKENFSKIKIRKNLSSDGGVFYKQRRPSVGAKVIIFRYYNNSNNESIE